MERKQTQSEDRERLRERKALKGINRQDSKLYDDFDRILNMEEMMVNKQYKFEELEGKDIVILVGTTGSGKSTIAQSIVKGAESMDFDEE